MPFEWDEAKNCENLRKHGLDFETAAKIFDGLVLTRFDDGDYGGEIREISIGGVGAETILVVVHTDRNGTTRIISARRATRNERRLYNDEIAKHT